MSIKQQQEINDLKARVTSLEAAIAALKDQLSARPETPVDDIVRPGGATLSLKRKHG